MNPLDWLGAGLCHQASWRMMEQAWLCDRCTGLYLGGFIGVAMAGAIARRLGLRTQVLLFLLFLLPMAVDKLVFGMGSAIDVRTERIFTGLMAGAGTGLFLGARAVGHIRWPARLEVLRRRPAILAWSLTVIAVIVTSAGSFVLLNSLVLLGLVMLCVAGTAWALVLLGALWTKLRGRSPEATRPSTHPLWLLLLIVFIELVIVTITPNEYKPHMGWFWSVLAALGIGRWY